MRCYIEDRLAIFHIPKTAGTSLAKLFEIHKGLPLLFNKKILHEPLYTKKKIFADHGYVLDDFTIITTVRNPYSRLVSLWTWLRRDDVTPGQLKKYPWIYDVRAMTNFEEMIDWYLVNIDSYEDMLKIDGSMPNNIHIIRFENLKEDSQEILNRKLDLNIDTSRLPHIYKTDHSDFKEYFDARLMNKVRQKEQWFINKFNY